jgi:hypothetical protein
MDEGYMVTYPLRIPVVGGALQKRRCIDRLAKQLRDRNYSVEKDCREGNYLVDIKVNGNLLLINPIPRDPFFRIHKRLMRREVLEISTQMTLDTIIRMMKSE